MGDNPILSSLKDEWLVRLGLEKEGVADAEVVPEYALSTHSITEYLHGLS